MTEVVITRDDRIEAAIIEALERIPLASVVRGTGERDTGKMRFPKLSLTEAIGAFTEAAYGTRLDFEHA